jgi:hypothetical protein
MVTQLETHDRGVQRLNAARYEEDRLAKDLLAATGTSREMSADVALHIAHAQVMARNAWLRWVDDASYHGLNAGPFALQAELEETLGPVG